MSTHDTTIYPLEDWGDDDGPVLWHHIGEWGDLCEAPVVARGPWELADLEPWPGYYTYWSRLPALPRFPERSLMIAPPGMLICDPEWAHVR